MWISFKIMMGNTLLNILYMRFISSSSQRCEYCTEPSEASLYENRKELMQSYPSRQKSPEQVNLGNIQHQANSLQMREEAQAPAKSSSSNTSVGLGQSDLDF